jgi:hypothetical protein
VSLTLSKVIKHLRCYSDKPGKIIVEAVAEVVQFSTFWEVADIRRLSMKKIKVTTALQVQEIRAGLDNEKQGRHNCD